MDGRDAERTEFVNEFDVASWCATNNYGHLILQQANMVPSSHRFP